MYIQYVGFNIADNSRIYNFDVIDPKKAREFTVAVRSEAFRAASLKLQDGPNICFARLKQELLKETPESSVEAHLRITEHDIQEYLEQHPSRQAPGKWRPRTADGPA